MPKLYPSLKKEIIYTVIVFVSGFLHILLLLYSWKLKTGEISIFSPVPVLLILSFSLNLFLLFRIYGFFTPDINKKKKSQGTEKAPRPNNPETGPVKEIINPKTSVEKLLKNVMLKRSAETFGEKLLSNFARGFDIVQGVFYEYNKSDRRFEPRSFYAITDPQNVDSFKPGESIPGQAVMKEDITEMKNIPESYRIIESGLGNRSPKFIYFIPLLHEKTCIALLEISTFKEISEQKLDALKFFMSFAGKKFSQFREKINV